MTGDVCPDYRLFRSLVLIDFILFQRNTGAISELTTHQQLCNNADSIDYIHVIKSLYKFNPAASLSFPQNWHMSRMGSLPNMNTTQW